MQPLSRWTASAWMRIILSSAVLLSLATVLSAHATLVTPARSHAGAPYLWTQFGGDATHSNDNSSETILNATNVASLAQLFRVSIPMVIDGSLVYAPGVNTSNGTRDLLFGNEKNGTLVAFPCRAATWTWAAMRRSSSHRWQAASMPT